MGRLLETAKRLHALSLSERMAKQVEGRCEDIKTLSLVPAAGARIAPFEIVSQPAALAVDCKQPEISTRSAVDTFDNSLADVVPRDHRIA